MSRQGTIYVLAGVNGAGKSSLGERIFRDKESIVFNPDTIAARIRTLHPAISASLANGHAWQIGRSLLEKAIETGSDYRFETTLGGRTIVSLLEQAARKGHQVNVWFCGLESPELHIQRVRSRVAQGGHDIPEAKIHERWRSSRENLIRLLPCLHHLRVYDNSHQADPAAGQCPRPKLWLEMRARRVTAPMDLTGAPEWVQPIIAAGLLLQRMEELG